MGGGLGAKAPVFFGRLPFGLRRGVRARAHGLAFMVDMFFLVERGLGTTSGTQRLRRLKVFLEVP